VSYLDLRCKVAISVILRQAREWATSSKGCEKFSRVFENSHVQGSFCALAPLYHPSLHTNDSFALTNASKKKNRKKLEPTTSRQLALLFLPQLLHPELAPRFPHYWEIRTTLSPPNDSSNSFPAALVSCSCSKSTSPPPSPSPASTLAHPLLLSPTPSYNHQDPNGTRPTPSQVIHQLSRTD
jgi:hypothetical protein